MDELHVHTMARVHKFSKNLEAISKTLDSEECHKEVQNLKYKHSLGVVAHMIWKYLEYVCHLTQSCKWLSSLGTLEMQSSHVFWRLYTLKSNSDIMERIKRDVLSVSKSVA